MNCSQCQTANPEGAKFCMSCGSPLAASCPECGTELPTEARFCLNCGHQLGQASEAASVRAQLEQYIPRELLQKLESARTSGGIQGERRVVTMLFCDVTGSTAAAEQLDPEEWAQIIKRGLRAPDSAGLSLRGHVGPVDGRRDYGLLRRPHRPRG